MNLTRSRGVARSEATDTADFALVIALASLIASRMVALRCFPIFDDAFITLRYGSNLANGHGFVFNSSDWVLGTTSPLYGLIAAGVFLLHLEPTDFFPMLNVVIDGILIVLVRRYLFPTREVAFAVFWVLFCGSPILARTSVGAMEVDMFAAATLSTLILYSQGSKRTAIALGALSYFIRPEGFLTVALLCLWEWLSARRVRESVIMGLIALAIVVPVLAMVAHLYGSFLPQSVIAKSSMMKFRPLVVIWQLLAPEPIAVLAAILAFVSIPEAVRHGTLPRLLTIWFLLYVAAYAVSGAHIWSWYSFAPLFCATVLSGYGVSAVVERVPVLRSRLAPAVPWLAPGAVAAVWVVIGLTQPVDEVTSHIYHPLMAYCREHLTATDTILARDIGAVGYSCPGFIYDADGLVWPQARAYGSLWKMIEAKKPTYIFLDVNGTALKSMAASPLVEEYMPVLRFAKDGVTDPRRVHNVSYNWVQEYILYRRRALR